MTKRRSRKKAHKLSPVRVILCALVECVVIAALVVMVGWNYGVKDWVENIRRPVVKELDLTGIQSPCAILIQADGGRVIAEISGDEKIYPASMTKIMTALLAIEELKDLDEEITLDIDIFPGLYAQDATRAGFEPWETVKVRDLIYGILLPSGGECCLTLAERISGSEEAFVELMNKKAASFGMENTHFCNTTGLHDPDHYSTPRDMAILLKFAIRNRTFREVAESPWHSTPPTNVHPDGITFYSTLLKALGDPSVPGGEILGGKTGYTDEAGYCLASYAEILGRDYILVTAGAPDNGSASTHIQDARTVFTRLGEAALALEEEQDR